MQNMVVRFTIGEPCCALPLSCVEKVIRAVEISPLPHAPEIVMGVINSAGTMIPVINVRRRFHFSDRALSVCDRFIIARTARRLIAMVVDSVEGISELTDEEMIPVEQTPPFADHLSGVAKLQGNLIMIYNLDQFLNLDEEENLKNALNMAKEGDI